MRLTFRLAAPDGETFDADAFAGVVGNMVPAGWAGTIGPAVLTAARVLDGGRAVELTLEVEGLEGELGTVRAASFRRRDRRCFPTASTDLSTGDT